MSIADYSSATPAYPAAGSGLIATVPPNAGRGSVEVQNQSASTIQVVRDDGNGGAATVILLAPGAGAGQQGGGWKSTTFRGRVRVYAPPGSQIAICED